MGSLDVAAARASFPALKQRQVYFDNAGGSQTLGTVIDSQVDPALIIKQFFLFSKSDVSFLHHKVSVTICRAQTSNLAQPIT